MNDKGKDHKDDTLGCLGIVMLLSLFGVLYWTAEIVKEHYGTIHAIGAISAIVLVLAFILAKRII